MTDTAIFNRRYLRRRFLTGATDKLNDDDDDDDDDDRSMASARCAVHLTWNVGH